MFSYITTYAILLLFTPYLIAAGAKTNTKYGKGPTPPFYTDYGACWPIREKYPGYNTGKQLYDNVLKEGVWLAGGTTTGTGSNSCSGGCGSCVRLKDKSNKPIEMYFLIVDYEPEFTIAPNALARLEELNANYVAMPLVADMKNCTITGS
ncbi:hypothetical protein TWF718_001738 [Orbilia javanica]|uniref:Uncharacterized protein n=1 Tax=Orbilia javanica TaxID=47235 RepID=A0AAN8N196_9PEZI